MKPFEKILVPVDFSPYSSAAIAAAVDLSRRYDGIVTLLHVFEPGRLVVPDGLMFYMPGQLENLLAEYAKLLEKTKAETQAAGALRIETRQAQGIASDEIVELARSEKFDLIVMGTHGRTGVKHALIGSVAERVVRTAPCPVLTVKTQEPVR